MKLFELPLLKTEIIQVEPVSLLEYDPALWTKNRTVSIYDNNGDIYLISDGNKLEVKGVNQRQQDFLMQMPLESLLGAVARGGKKNIDIRYLIPVSQDFINTPIQFRADEKIFDRIREIEGAEISRGSALIEWLNIEFILGAEEQEANGKSVFATVYGGHANDQSFQIIGRKWQLHIYSNRDGIYSIERIARIANQSSLRVRQLSGDIQIIDAQQAQLLASPEGLRELRHAMSHGSYMELWKDYHVLQTEKDSKEARRVGALKYASASLEGDTNFKCCFTVNNKERLHEFAQELFALDSPMLEISQEKPAWLNIDNKQFDYSRNLKVSRSIMGRFFSVQSNQIIIEFDDRDRLLRLPKKGFLYLSLLGTMVSQDRRNKAYEQIESSNTPLRALRHLLEGSPIPAIRRGVTNKPLTAYSKQVFKGGHPTGKQIDAIRLALNSTDMFLIQGPPGTGKTQVIAALQRRLLEVSDNSPNSVLLSSYQHDAVDNVLQRVDAFGLPAIKVGRQGGNKQEKGVDLITKWRKEREVLIGHYLKEKFGENPILSILKKVDMDILSYVTGTLLVNEQCKVLKSILDNIIFLRDKFSININPEWFISLKGFVDEVERKKVISDDNRGVLLKRIRALRITKVSFKDDGADQAYRVKRILIRKGLSLSRIQIKILDTAADCFECPKSDFLEELSEVKNQLLDICRPDYRPVQIRRDVDTKHAELLHEISSKIRESLLGAEFSELTVVDEYRSSLRNEPWQIEKAVNYYSKVYGATCQQAGSEKMVNLKGLSSGSVVFDTVIVDEAARANPLDLAIPMVMAGKRVILVGDQRQLPHLLEKDTEELLSKKKNLSDKKRESLQESLFGRLFRQFKEMEQRGGPCRTVTLDKQFRMHPELGNFVSKNFYEEHGDSKIKSDLKAEDFLHTVPMFVGKVAGWINVPAASPQQFEKRLGSSWVRKIEAKRVASEVRNILDLSTTTSIGVITFYAAQREEIMRALNSEGVCQRADTGWKVKPKFQTYPGEDGIEKERLRIGSVDAFQGKEFDVVLLSMTRCNAFDAKDEKGWNRKFGFLRLENRLNVAMSRQRQLLIVVGDKSMVDSNDAKQAVPAMYNYLKFCEGEHGIII